MKYDSDVFLNEVRISLCENIFKGTLVQHSIIIGNQAPIPISFARLKCPNPVPTKLTL